MEEEKPIKIYCGNCDSIFSITRYPVSIDPDQDIHEVGIGYHGEFGVGEEGVWFCPFCGEDERYAPLKEIEAAENSPYDYDEEDVRGL